jgi:serine/threonine-protein kinase
MVDRSALELLGRGIATEQSQSWVGRQIGHYLVSAPLGHGGMGVVYRARDVRLRRDVAIKALPLVYSADPARLQRFEQEARAAGQLNHPNIVTVHDIGVHDNAPYIVTELLEGEDLRQQLNGKALPHRRALSYAQQIVRGLAATHAKGIVHRDLKPENLFVTSDGRVKILDFGLAKLAAVSAAEATRPSERILGLSGPVAGTIGYLAPEQLRGEGTDHRADLFAFGAIVYEMLTGRRAWERESLDEVVAATLSDDPPDLDHVGHEIAPALNSIVRRCLEKNPQQRFQSASDLAFALDMFPAATAISDDANRNIANPHDATGNSRPKRWLGTNTALLVALLGAAIGAAVVWNAQDTAPRIPSSIARLMLPVQSGAIVEGDVEISPDGRDLAYATGPRGHKTLVLRSLANQDATPLTEIEYGDAPFFSPDSQWLGFFAAGKLKKVSVHGGAVVTLADAPANSGADWGEHGSIVFAPIARGGLFEISANGGVARALTTLDANRGETSHVHPRWLPRGRAVVYVARGETDADRSVVAFSPDDRQRRVLLKGDAIPRYSPTGHLIYLPQGALMAAAFDLNRLQVLQTPTPVVEDAATYAFSDAGLLIYAPRLRSGATQARLMWVTREGQAEPLKAPPRNYNGPRLSPDERRVALSAETGGDGHIWIYDLVRDSLTRLTFDGRNGWPLWSHDSVQVIYASNRAGTSWDIYRKGADGTGAEELLLRKPLLQIPQSLTDDGRILGFTDISPSSPRISLLTINDRMLRGQPASGWTPSLSADGRWVAYVSSETGRYEVYVRAATGGVGKWLISTDGGVEPVWSGSGSELFYRNGDQVLAVDVVTDGSFEHRTPRVLFEGRYRLGGVNVDDTRNYDVTRDGRRFLMLKDDEQPLTSHLNVVVNWFDDFQRLLASRN